MTGLRGLAALALAAGCLFGSASFGQATAPQEADAAAMPRGNDGAGDPVFRVGGRELGLERVVEMYQWTEVGGGYSQAWSSVPIDSSAFAPGHENPPFPLQPDRWLPGAITVDGHPLDPSVVKALGEWREFRPGFSALPGNLSATFQPEGNGLGSAENPLAPQVGDLRVHWRELVLPPLGERIELRDGRWQLRADAPPVAAGKPADGGWMAAWLPILLGCAGLLLLVILVARKRG